MVARVWPMAEGAVTRRRSVVGLLLGTAVGFGGVGAAGIGRADQVPCVQIAVPAAAHAAGGNALNSIIAVVGIAWRARSTFMCLSPGDTLSGATISWGDGTATPASVSYAPTAAYAPNPTGAPTDRIMTVTATATAEHAYFTPALHGVYVTASATDQPSGQRLSAAGGGPQVLPRDELRAVGIRVRPRRFFGGIVAIITAPNAANAGGVPDDRLTATVKWGQGVQSLGSISETGTGYVLRASHRWTRTGIHRFVVTLVDSIGPQRVSAVGEASVHP